jgi:hypothetical protein
VTAQDQSAEPAFLADLADEVVLTGSVLRHAVTGRATVADLILATGAAYKSQAGRFHGAFGLQEFMAYDAVLTDGTAIRGDMVLTWNTSGKVEAIHVGHSPLDAAMSLSRILGRALAGRVPGALTL